MISSKIRLDSRFKEFFWWSGKVGDFTPRTRSSIDGHYDIELIMSRSDPISDARSITASLQKSTNVMGSTVTTANTAVGNLMEDGDTIRETLDEHKFGLKVGLEDTNRKLNRVQTAEQREKWMVWSSLAFFTSVVLYIIAKRLRILALLSLLSSGALKGGNILKQLYGEKEIKSIQKNSAELFDTTSLSKINEVSKFIGFDEDDENEIENETLSEWELDSMKTITDQETEKEVKVKVDSSPKELFVEDLETNQNVQEVEVESETETEDKAMDLAMARITAEAAAAAKKSSLEQEALHKAHVERLHQEAEARSNENTNANTHINANTNTNTNTVIDQNVEVEVGIGGSPFEVKA
jgi:hypothetical protein